MKTRKNEIPCELIPSPSVWHERRRGTVKSTCSGSFVEVASVDCKKISEEQLDPASVNLTTLLASGCYINPSSFVNVFNISDVADLDAIQARENSKISKYIDENYDALKNLIKNEK